MVKDYDFSGWATRANLRCSDGRVILPGAFADQDGMKVPLVWNHEHNSNQNVLGHAILENRDEGVYAYCKFNETESGQNAKLLVKHGDVTALSIYANKLKQKGSHVVHGAIRELSLVLAGANPGAFIDSVICHDDGEDEEAIIYSGMAGEEDFFLAHADGNEEEKKDMATEETKKTPDEGGEETIADVLKTFNEKQKTVMYALIGKALEDKGGDNNDEEDSNMKHNVFDTEETQEDVLTHSEMSAIFSDAKRGTLSEAVLAHGIEHIDYLFPEAKSVDATPQFIQRDVTWVKKFMGAVHHTPFSRIKSMFADITEDEARAKGYIKGNLKKEEVFSLLKRSTDPTTVYKKQKMDRDDVIDIVDFDVVAWIKSEMRMMLDEELARAMLVGDGRLPSSDEKIDESRIRPIWKDSDLFTIKYRIETGAADDADTRAKAFIRAAVKSRKEYKGSGNPTLYTTEDLLTDCLLLEDRTGRRIYDTVTTLATAMRVKEIVTVPVMEGLSREDKGEELKLMGLIVNVGDYNVGADKGGAVNMFDDFDIDYNAQKYLIETRCSGALTKPYSAIALEEHVTAAASGE
jgi:HK97 family phage prohead protease